MTFVIDNQRQPKPPAFTLSLRTPFDGVEAVELPPEMAWKVWDQFIDTERLPLRTE